MAGFSLADLVAQHLGLGQDGGVGTDNAKNFFASPRVNFGKATATGGFEGFGEQPYEMGPVGKAHWGGEIPRAWNNAPGTVNNGIYTADDGSVYDLTKDPAAKAHAPSGYKGPIDMIRQKNPISERWRQPGMRP